MAICRAYPLAWPALGPAALLALGLLPGCSLFSSSAPISTIGFDVVENANGNAPIPIDLVLVGTNDLVPTIMGLTAAEWFNRKAQLLRDAPTDLRAESFEVVPGSTIAPRDVDRTPRPKAAILFANYQTPGAHRIRLVTQEDAVVHAGARDFTVNK